MNLMPRVERTIFRLKIIVLRVNNSYRTNQSIIEQAWFSAVQSRYAHPRHTQNGAKFAFSTSSARGQRIHLSTNQVSEIVDHRSRDAVVLVSSMSKFTSHVFTFSTDSNHILLINKNHLPKFEPPPPPYPRYVPGAIAEEPRKNTTEHKHRVQSNQGRLQYPLY